MKENKNNNQDVMKEDKVIIGSIYFALLILIILSLAIIWGCKKNDISQIAFALPVNAVKAQKIDLPWQLEYPAQISASMQVDVRAQVGGILQARLFQEGSYQEQGKTLFQIDETDYKLAQNRAESALQQAQTSTKNALQTYKRLQKLLPSKAVSQQDFDTAKNNYDSALANENMARATLESTKVDLTYTKVEAPISGITGDAVQSVGNLISVGQLLTTMQQINPLHINFAMPSKDFHALVNAYNKGNLGLLQPETGAPLKIQVILPNGEPYQDEGRIIYFSASEDDKTASINIKAEIKNPLNKRVLLPGQFVRVKVRGASYKDVIVVPSSSILQTAKGQVLYIVENGQAKAIFPEVEIHSNLAIIKSGLQGDETVIIGGLMKLKNGMPVAITLEEFSPLANDKIATENQQGTADFNALLQNNQPNTTQDIRR